MRPRVDPNACVIKTSITLTEKDDAYLIKIIVRESRALMDEGVPRSAWPTRSSVVRRIVQEHREREERQR